MIGKTGIGKTIGEVEKITGIPKRTLKYFIEQGLVQPAEKSESGYWLYTEEDIRCSQLAALCRELDFPVRTARRILTDPARHWQRELEGQITRLAEEKRRTTRRLDRAEALRRGWRQEPYPALFLLRRIREKGGRVTVTADAHSAGALTFGYDAALAQLRRAGFRTVWELYPAGWREVPIP